MKNIYFIVNFEFVTTTLEFSFSEELKDKKKLVHSKKITSISINKVINRKKKIL